MTARDELTDWEILLIQVAVRRFVDQDKVHPEHGKALADKLETATAIWIIPQV